MESIFEQELHRLSVISSAMKSLQQELILAKRLYVLLADGPPDADNYQAQAVNCGTGIRQKLEFLGEQLQFCNNALESCLPQAEAVSTPPKEKKKRPAKPQAPRGVWRRPPAACRQATE